MSFLVPGSSAHRKHATLAKGDTGTKVALEMVKHVLLRAPADRRA